MDLPTEEEKVSSGDFRQMKEFVHNQLIFSTENDPDGNRMRWYPWHSADYRFIHTLNVIDISTKIAEKESANIDLVRVSALFHDIAKFSSSQKTHAQDGANIALKHLTENFNFSENFNNTVHQIISNHVYSGPLNDLSIESQCLIEADMIDKIGANGCSLLLLRMGYESRHPWESSKNLQKVITRGKETLSKVVSDTAYSICYQRLQRTIWLKEWLDDEISTTSDMYSE
jgi:uncharacterized protein